MNNLVCPQCGEAYHINSWGGHCECGECFYRGEFSDFASDSGNYYADSEPFDDMGELT
jgi:hypothetical protein